MLTELLQKIPVRSLIKNFLIALQIQIPLRPILYKVEVMLLNSGIEKWTSLAGSVLVGSTIAYGTTEIFIATTEQIIYYINNLRYRNIINNVAHEVIHDNKLENSKDNKENTLPMVESVPLATTFNVYDIEHKDNIVDTVADADINNFVNEDTHTNTKSKAVSDALLNNEHILMETENMSGNHKRKLENENESGHSKRLKSNRPNNDELYTHIIRPDHRDTYVGDITLLRSKTQLKIVTKYNPNTGCTENNVKTQGL